jgi:uncharacterized protein involved in exopolysaccharide biosynthesis
MFDDPPPAPSQSPEQFFRRRLLVFCGAFLFASLLSLTWVFIRPAEYRAVALVEITPPELGAESADARLAPGLEGDPKSFLTEVKVVTSRPLVEATAKRLKAAGLLPDLGKDPVGALQNMLHAEPIKGTQLVQISASSAEQGLVATLANTVAYTYRTHLAKTYRERASGTIAEVQAEARKLHEQAQAKQVEIDAFRERYDIVSLDRKENEVLAKIDGLNRSYSESSQQAATAAGKLQALRSAMAAGKPIPRPVDEPGLAAIQQQIAALQDTQRQLLRKFNSAYLALDEDTKNIPGQIAELQQQLRQNRMESAQANIAEAQGAVSGARASIGRAQADMNQNQQSAKEFAARLATLKAMQEDQDHLQAMERAVKDRAAKLQASEQARAPQVRLVELAAPALSPWRPHYSRDAMIALAGSLLFALAATWLAEYLHGPKPARAIMVQHSLSLPGLGRIAAPALQVLAKPLFGLTLPGADERASLPAPEAPARVLDNAEITALIGHAPADLKLAAVALLSGLDTSEIASLTWEQVGPGHLRILGAAAREIPLEGALATLLAGRRTDTAQGPVLRKESGDAFAAQDIDQLISYGAYDAGLVRPEQVTATLLRYSYLTFLLDQGVRATDIARIAGHVPQADMVGFMQRAAPRVRRPLEQVDRVHPALHMLAT